MNFTTPTFLFLFLPLVLCGYWISGPKLRAFTLLGVSLFFYAWGEGRYVIVLCLAIGTNYLFTLAMDRCQRPSRRRLALFSIIAINLAVLFAFKYPDLARRLAAGCGVSLAALLPLHQPLGISFFTFQAIAYAVDVYRRMFTTISAGPILRYDEVDEALAGSTVTMGACAYGAKRFIVGMGKKLIIADTLAKTADQIFAIPAGDLTAPIAWLGIVCYTLQLYFDFSGYSDMAIGLGRMLGFNFRENFDYPYVSRSLTEFWRRWHISLSTWFRDYLYLPLVYSLMTEKIRRTVALGKYRTNYRSLFCIVVVFTLCGWWHGPTWNFIVWGALHGIILSAEAWKLGKLLKKAPAAVAHSYALLVIMLCWVFFRCSTLGGAFSYLAALAGFGTGTGVNYSIPLYLNSELAVTLALSVIAAMPGSRYVHDRLSVALPAITGNWPAKIMETGAVTVIFLASLLSVASSTYKPFIYFRF